jgi:hypothetical protein
MFNNLLKLYKSNTKKTPLEDFTTEVFASILAENNDMLDKFVNDFLHVGGSNFVIVTQKHYSNFKSIVDMVFENETSIIFLENKVDSKERNNQLFKYSNILKENYKNR